MTISRNIRIGAALIGVYLSNKIDTNNVSNNALRAIIVYGGALCGIWFFIELIMALTNRGQSKKANTVPDSEQTEDKK